MKHLPFVTRGEVKFEVAFTDPDGVEKFRAVQTEREVRLTLSPDERWPDEVRRGKSLDVEFGLDDRIYRLTGRVRFRRLNVAVIQGTFARLSHSSVAPLA